MSVSQSKSRIWKAIVSEEISGAEFDDDGKITKLGTGKVYIQYLNLHEGDTYEETYYVVSTKNENDEELEVKVFNSSRYSYEEDDYIFIYQDSYGTYWVRNDGSRVKKVVVSNNYGTKCKTFKNKEYDLEPPLVDSVTIPAGTTVNAYWDYKTKSYRCLDNYPQLFYMVIPQNISLHKHDVIQCKYQDGKMVMYDEDDNTGCTYVEYMEDVGDYDRATEYEINQENKIIAIRPYQCDNYFQYWTDVYGFLDNFKYNKNDRTLPDIGGARIGRSGCVLFHHQVGLDSSSGSKTVLGTDGAEFDVDYSLVNQGNVVYDLRPGNLIWVIAVTSVDSDVRVKLYAINCYMSFLDGTIIYAHGLSDASNPHTQIVEDYYEKNPNRTDERPLDRYTFYRDRFMFALNQTDASGICETMGCLSTLYEAYEQGTFDFTKAIGTNNSVANIGLNFYKVSQTGNGD